jgi:hypothetical protein
MSTEENKAIRIPNDPPDMGIELMSNWSVISKAVGGYGLV